jgi:hypothetical protein
LLFIFKSEKNYLFFKGESDFNFSPVRCNHIVQENLPYKNRSIENINIVSLFEYRYQNRNRSSDKNKNRLTSIPGSPGSGKSTFLTHFPESVEYKNYIVNRNKNLDPIVYQSYLSMALWVKDFHLLA